MTSFMRQLNNYGFSKVKPTDLNDKTCEFEHEHNLLQPNRPDLLFKIARRRTARRGGADSKKTRPSAHQLFRPAAAVPVPKRQTSVSAMQSPPPPTSSSSAATAAAAASTNAAAATVVDQQSLAQTVAALQAHLAAQAALLAQGGVAVSAEVAAALQKTAMLLSTQTPLVRQPQAQDQETHEQTSPSSNRPRRSASVAARDAIRAAVQEGGEDVTDDVDVVSRDLHSLASASYAVSAAGRHQSATGNAADESSEFDSHGDGSHASISEMAQNERSQAQMHRLRMHEDKLSLTSNGGAKPFAFAVPQVPSGTKQSSSQAQPQASSSSAAQAAQPQVVVQARVGLTKSGEVWKSMIQAAVVEPSPVVNTAALTLMTSMDMPRSNSVSDFFGAKREAAENALDATEFRDVLLDDTRGFLKSSHGIKM
jgi:hypothetical protein